MPKTDNLVPLMRKKSEGISAPSSVSSDCLNVPPTKVQDGHSGDCTIYAAMDNGRATDGICTCGYGLRMYRKCDYSHMYSKSHESHESQ